MTSRWTKVIGGLVPVVAVLVIAGVVWADANGQRTSLDRRVGLDQADGGAQLSPAGFGKKLAGAWLSILVLEKINGERLEDPIVFPSHAVLSAEGGTTVSDANDFGAGDPENVGLDSPAYGTWTRTGPQQFSARQMFFSYDVQGNLTTITRTFVVSETDREFTEATLTWRSEVFLPGQLLDPLDPNTGANPVGTAEGTGVSKKLLPIDP